MIMIECENLAVHPPYAGDVPEAVAIVRHPNGTDWRFCKECLDVTLDQADLFPSFEPTAIAWRRTLGELDQISSTPTGG